MISSKRIARDIAEIARFSDTDARIGYSRPTFSDAWRAACDYVIAQARQVGCTARVDAAGNVHLRPAELPPDQSCWLSGSHLDSVPTGGQFDGVVGVVVPLEVLRAFPQAPLELVIFAEEEGTTFQRGMLGSQLWVGALDASQLADLRNSHGQDYLQAGASCGVQSTRIAQDRLQTALYRGFVEVHVEQGASLWNSGGNLAVVTAVNGRRQYQVTVTGANNHAGSTKMPDRRDALTAAAEMVTGLESLARQIDATSDHTVITVGRLSVEPNALNVIPGRVTFSIDFRARDDDTLDRGESELASLLHQIADRRCICVEYHRNESLSAIKMDPGVCQRLMQAAKQLGVQAATATSGALHDAAILAHHLPTAMVFVASRDGISHDPAEFSRIEDVALAARLLAELIVRDVSE
jgi:allantoate deiminase